MGAPAAAAAAVSLLLGLGDSLDLVKFFKRSATEGLSHFPFEQRASELMSCVIFSSVSLAVEICESVFLGDYLHHEE